MKPNCIIILLALFFSCCASNSTSDQTGNVKTDSVITSIAMSEVIDSAGAQALQAGADNQTLFLVIADTGLDYFSLRDKMFALNKSLKITIDTMGRYYNIKKNLIALPDDDEDEMYAGSYFPRRFPGYSLSLEYLSAYQKGAGKETIALVTGIFETQSSADSILAILKSKEIKSFEIKADINLGDVH